MAKVSSYTALSGTSVANGDEFYVVDGGVSKKITADELAQMPQLSSRYAPVPDKMWLPATAFGSVTGSPLFAAEPQGHWNPAWLLDASSVEIVSTTVLVPQGWNTYDIYLWWSNAGAGSGDVVVTVTDYTITTTGTFAGDYPKTITASARDTIVQSKMTSAALTRVSDVKMFTMRRNGTDAADTLGNDIGVNGLMLVKVS